MIWPHEQVVYPTEIIATGNFHQLRDAASCADECRLMQAMHDHGQTAPDGLIAALALPEGLSLIAALFLAGLSGGVTHCAGMCGPFVLGQVGENLGRVTAQDFGAWARLRGAALVPYHFGRLTTYSALGVVAGGLGGAFVEATRFRWALAGFLLLAALIFAAQAAGWQSFPRLAGIESLVTRIARPLFSDPKGMRGYALGLALGFLPCGLIYGGLAAAAGSGSPLIGGAGMAAFVVGTVPALLAVGWGGVLLGARHRKVLQELTRSLLALNAAMLGALALRMLW